jgi:TniQ
MRYEVWTVAPPEIPPRSVLYHLSPIAIGTPGVESLTSYLARLAEAHSISCGMLLKRLLLPYVPKVQWRCQVDGERSPKGVGPSLTARISSTGWAFLRACGCGRWRR